MDGNSLIRLLLGIPGSPEKGLGFLHSAPHDTQSIPLLGSACGQRAGFLILMASGPGSGPPEKQCLWNEEMSRFWRASAFMKQVWRAEVMCPRSDSSLAAGLGSVPESSAELEKEIR